MRISNITNEWYEDNDVKDVFNTYQAGLYIKFGCTLVDCYWLDDVKTLVHTFLRDDTFRRSHDLWCKKLLKDMTIEEFERLNDGV